MEYKDDDTKESTKSSRRSSVMCIETFCISSFVFFCIMLYN